LCAIPIISFPQTLLLLSCYSAFRSHHRWHFLLGEVIVLSSSTNTILPYLIIKPSKTHITLH
jgi:hypothetical protein